MLENDEQEFAWEYSKENVLPLKRGRDTKKMNSVLTSKKSERDGQLAEEQRKFEDAIQDNLLDDSLQIWIRYIKWLQAEFMSGCDSTFHVIERCTRSFKDDERYQDDIRYLRVWIQYADMLENPEDIFKFLYKKNIGTTHGLFWVAWACVTEKAKSFKKAEKIYTKGIEMLKRDDMRSEDLTNLRTRHSQFRRRAAKHYLAQEEGEATRQSSRSSAHHDSSVNDENSSDGRRKALGKISKKATKSGALRSSSSKSKLTIPTIKGSRDDNNGVARVRVFQDESIPRDDPCFLEGCAEESVVQWDDLGTHAERMKENTGKATTWSHVTMRAAKEKVTKPQAPSFELFVDETLAENEDAKEQGQAAETQKRGLVFRDPGQTETETEVLTKQPLKNILGKKEEVKGAEKEQKERAAKEEKAGGSKGGDVQGSKSKGTRLGYDKAALKGATANDELSFEEVRARKMRAKMHEKRKVATTARNQQQQQQPAKTPAGQALSRRLTFTAAKTDAAKNTPFARQAEAADQEDMTFNTKAALEDMATIFGFGSPAASPAMNPSAGAGATAASALDASANMSMSVIAKTPAAPAFAIFSDADAGVDAENQAPAIAQPPQSPPRAEQQPFTIFSNAGAENVENAAPATIAASTIHRSDSRTLSPPPTGTAPRSHAHSSPLPPLVPRHGAGERSSGKGKAGVHSRGQQQQLRSADGEDMTINTKLALSDMADIFSNISSPQSKDWGATALSTIKRGGGGGCATTAHDASTACFEIFSGETAGGADSTDVGGAGLGASGLGGAGAGAEFTIFSDENAGPGSAQLPTRATLGDEGTSGSDRTADVAALTELMQADLHENQNEVRSTFNRENQTPPRGLSNADRRSRTLHEAEDQVLQPVPLVNPAASATALSMVVPDDADAAAAAAVLSPRLLRQSMQLQQEAALDLNNNNDDENDGKSRGAGARPFGVGIGAGGGSMDMGVGERLFAPSGLFQSSSSSATSSGAHGAGFNSSNDSFAKSSKPARVEEFSIAGDIYVDVDVERKDGHQMGADFSATASAGMDGGGGSGAAASAASMPALGTEHSSAHTCGGVDEGRGDDFASRLAAFDESSLMMAAAGPFSHDVLRAEPEPVREANSRSGSSSSSGVYVSSSGSSFNDSNSYSNNPPKSSSLASASAAGGFTIFTDESASNTLPTTAAAAPSHPAAVAAGGFAIFSDELAPAQPQPAGNSKSRSKKAQKGDRRKTASPGSLADLMQALTEEEGLF